MSTRNRNAIETVSGREFDYDVPVASSILLDDIACSLGNSCRWRGQIRPFYSVAEHAVRVSRLVRDVTDDPEIIFAALHHDSHEAYLSDVPTPMKRKLGAVYHEMASQADAVICAALAVKPALLHHDFVVAADEMALRMEAYLLKPSKGIGPLWDYVEPLRPPRSWNGYGLPPRDAELAFRAEHQRCMREACGLG